MSRVLIGEEVVSWIGNLIHFVEGLDIYQMDLLDGRLILLVISIGRIMYNEIYANYSTCQQKAQNDRTKAKRSAMIVLKGEILWNG